MWSGTWFRSWLRRVALLAVAVAATSLPMAGAAQDHRIEALSYPVSGFEIEYALDHPAHPALAELEALEVALRVADGGLLPPHPSTPNVRFPLGRVPPGTRFYTAGLRHVSREILAVFQARGIDGVLVTLPDIETRTGSDRRAPGELRLRVRIWTGRIESVATVADGDRFGKEGLERRTNRAEHRFLREGSPVRPGGPKGLLRVREIEDYAFRQSRHPGRRVDALLKPGALPGTTRVDYHVAEAKPWMAYAQIANTGTEGTTRLRQRAGIGHNQITGNDDLLRVDYVTGNFDEVHGVWGLYEGPIWRMPRLRWAAMASYSEYDASEVGVSRIDAHGDQWQAGGRLLLEVFQHRELFVDLFAGASWRNVTVDSDTSLGGGGGFTFETGGEDDFFLPEVGLRVRRHTGISSTAFDLWLDHNLGSVAGTDEADLIALGSIAPDEDFTRLHWEGAMSIFLEPALRWRRWTDPTTPASSTLAHELLLVTKGQVSLGDRLIPQFQEIAGGLYSVRGYEQAVSAGDTVLVGSAEYRLHLARLLFPSADPPSLPVLGKVRIRPEHVYGRPDWDFILKAFVDTARVISVDRENFEKNEILIGLGLGAELQFMKNLSARVDLGWPQRRIESDEVEPEIHTALTVMF